MSKSLTIIIEVFETLAFSDIYSGLNLSFIYGDINLKSISSKIMDIGLFSVENYENPNF